MAIKHETEIAALLASPFALEALHRQPALLAKFISAIGKYGGMAALDVLKPLEAHERAGVSLAARAAVSLIELPPSTKVHPKLTRSHGIREKWEG